MLDFVGLGKIDAFTLYCTDDTPSIEKNGIHARYSDLPMNQKRKCITHFLNCGGEGTTIEPLLPFLMFVNNKIFIAGISLHRNQLGVVKLMCSLTSSARSFSTG